MCGGRQLNSAENGWLLFFWDRYGSEQQSGMQREAMATWRDDDDDRDETEQHVRSTSDGVVDEIFGVAIATARGKGREGKGISMAVAGWRCVHGGVAAVQAAMMVSAAGMAWLPGPALSSALRLQCSLFHKIHFLGPRPVPPDPVVALPEYHEPYGWWMDVCYTAIAN